MNDIVRNDNCELPDYYAFVRQAMANVQGAIDGGEVAQGHEVLTHHFAYGVYGRQMDVTANTLVISKMHRHETLNVFLKGRVALISNDGVQELVAPCVLVSPAGTQRIGFFHEDSAWLTVHPVDTQDLGEIERQVIVPDDEIALFLQHLQGDIKCLGEQ